MTHLFAHIRRLHEPRGRAEPRQGRDGEAAGPMSLPDTFGAEPLTPRDLSHLITVTSSPGAAPGKTGKPCLRVLKEQGKIRSGIGQENPLPHPRQGVQIASLWFQKGFPG